MVVLRQGLSGRTDDAIGQQLGDRAKLRTTCLDVVGTGGVPLHRRIQELLDAKAAAASIVKRPAGAGRATGWRSRCNYVRLFFAKRHRDCFGQADSALTEFHSGEYHLSSRLCRARR